MNEPDPELEAPFDGDDPDYFDDTVVEDTGVDSAEQGPEPLQAGVDGAEPGPEPLEGDID